MRGYLKALRDERGMSQQDIANKVNITRQYYSLIEGGERQQRMDVTLATKLADAFNISPQRIYDEEAKAAYQQEAKDV